MTTQSPPWPSLYNPIIELIHISHHLAVQPGGRYLYVAFDIYRFTLYWTLIFYTPVFALCGMYALLNIMLAPNAMSRTKRYHVIPMDSEHIESYPLNEYTTPSPSPAATQQQHKQPLLSPPRPNPRRTRATYALIVLLSFLTAGVLGAVLSSAVIGYSLAGLFNAADFNMSTWIPFLFAFIQTLISLLGVWPSVIEIL